MYQAPQPAGSGDFHTNPSMRTMSSVAAIAPIRTGTPVAIGIPVTPTVRIAAGATTARTTTARITTAAPIARLAPRPSTTPTDVAETADALDTPTPHVSLADELDHSQACPWLAKYPRRRPSATRRYLRLKRATDIALVAIVAPLWLPLVGMVALLIALTSAGAPVVFKQHRTGQGTRRFMLYKFRTMVPNAEELKAQLQHLNQRAWPDFKIDPDPRVTRLGRVLRKTSLDELPQLFNVLRGDMSLVGPRPTTLAPDAFEPWQLARFSGPVGLTGVWQVAGRAHPSFIGRVRLDLNYLERACWRLDAEILLRTIPGMLRRQGA